MNLKRAALNFGHFCPFRWLSEFRCLHPLLMDSGYYLPNTFVEAVKVLKGKITGGGDDDWFVLRVQDLEKPKKESSVGEAIVDFFCFTDWIDVLKKSV